MANHLIIGLGGTGGKVLREFRRRVFEEYGERNLENPKNGEYFEYVYVDSSESDLNERWEAMATNISLGEAQKVNIHSVPSGMLSDLRSYPGLDSFVNEQEVSEMNSKIGQSITAGIGGQRRRLGRILLASNLASISNQQNFEHAIRAAVGRLHQKSGQAKVTFHICAGLAGGTGSGTVVDTICLLRKWFPYDIQTHSNKILLLLYVPESTMVDARHDAGYYQANGYAALQEINALALGQYKPFDITGQLTATGQHGRITAGFEAAYVYSNISESGNVKDLQKRLPTDVAEFLFQSISMSGGQLQRLTDCENNPPTPENDQSGNPAHSCQFMTFGVLRVEYPEVEIRQFATYSFALQAVRELLYNHWVNGLGYDVLANNQVGLTYSSDVREPGTLQRLKLTDDYLTLSLPISEEGTSNWQSIKNTWGKYSESSVGSVERFPNQKAWPTKLSAMMRDFYENNFRSIGVRRFYEVQNANLEAYASLVCQHIENELFKEWVAGTRSVLEVARFVEELTSACQERVEKYDEIVAHELSEGQRSANSASVINAKFNDIGFIGNKVLSKPQKLIHQYKDELEKQYRHETMACAMQYAKDLMMRIVNKLTTLQNTLKEVNDQFVEIVENAKKEVASRCSVNIPQDGIVRYYNPATIRQIIKQFEQTKKYQDLSLAGIRSEMVSMIGNDGHETFSLMKNKIDSQSAVGIILNQCERVAVSAMVDYGNANPTDRLIDVNILEKLRTSFTKQEDMENFVKDVLAGAKCNFQFENTQSATVYTPMPHMVQLRIPDAVGGVDVKFRNDIIAEFGRQFAGFNATNDVALCDKNNRIVVVCAWSNMPLRVMKNTAILKEKYDNLVSPNNQNGAFNRMLLHTESFQPNSQPQLFNLTPVEVKKMAFEPLLLAFALDILPQQNDPMLGLSVYTIQEQTATGVIPHSLGINFARCWKTLEGSHRMTRMLIDRVNQEMASRVITMPQKNEIASKIREVMQAHILTSLCDNNPLNPDWAYYNQEAANVISNRLS